MNASIDDFLKEINEIGEKKDTGKAPEDVWQECHDERTGFPYYWNTVTDEVTWTKPKSFVLAKTPKRPKSPEKKTSELFLPPASTIHSTPTPKAVKIYSLQETKTQSVPIPNLSSTPVYSIQQSLNEANCKTVSKTQQTKKQGSKLARRDSDSDDEKIELITSYGGDSDSEQEEEDKSIKKDELKTRLEESHESMSEEDEEDLLAKIQKRAKELKALGGDVPPEIKNIIKKPTVEKSNSAKIVAGFSLVGAYSDSEEEQEEGVTTPFTPKLVTHVIAPSGVFNPTAAPVLLEPVVPESGHSTLFPITKPVDVNDFIGPSMDKTDSTEKCEKLEEIKNVEVVETKAFQRKRRIGVSLMNTKKAKEDIQNGDTIHKGLGFKPTMPETGNSDATDNIYSGFQKGGVMFVKSDDTLNPNTTAHATANDFSTSESIKSNKNVQTDVEDDIEAVFKKAEAEDTYNMIKEKLSFLSEGRPSVLPVQIMLIQAETLFTAMKQNALKVAYLINWLQETGLELISLEKQAAPEGWLLQWDRSHKRYYYQNQNTGETQWQYPEPDVDRCDEAMDICTTPPPPAVDPPPPPIGPTLPRPPGSPIYPTAEPPLPTAIGPSLPYEAASVVLPPPPPPPPPPSPPQIRAPSPPPPPIITAEERSMSYNSIVMPLPAFNVPLPPPNPVDSQPLPPGVDPLEPPSVSTSLEDSSVKPDFSSVLDSFYSEIAEATNDSQSPAEPGSTLIEEQPSIGIADFQNASEEPLKKKKKKVKTAGLSLKRKGVSQLVEKWKNVQNNF